MNFTNQILDWYYINKRDLPWRTTKDPYHIWLSEIIMQQTQIIQGTSYYLKFIERFPSIFHLAETEEQNVLWLWQGLGYYTRARNMNHTAKIIVENYQGKFPENYLELKALKGIGDYTASMILSVCFGQKFPAVDGNVLRVMSRIHNISEPVNNPVGFNRIKTIAAKLIPDKLPGDFNQALMEFGAIQCIPKKPDCNICIFKQVCQANRNNSVQLLPYKVNSKPKTCEYFYYFFCKDLKGKCYIKKRKSGIWKGLYEFPLIFSKIGISDSALFNKFSEHFNIDGFKLTTNSEVIKHQLTHKILIIKFFVIELPTENPISFGEYSVVDGEHLSDYPFPVIIQNFIKHLPLHNTV